MEVTGLAVGVFGLAGLFSACLDSLSRFQNYRQSNTETHVLDTRFRAARARFEQWGASVGISNGQLQPDHHRELDNKETANLIESILQIISKTICEDSILQRRRTGAQLQAGHFGGQVQSRSKRLKWALGGKESRNEQVDVFEKLVQQLYNLIPPRGKSQDYEGLESTTWVENIRQMLTKIEEGINSETQRDVLSWVGKSAPNDKYEDSLAKRVDATCEWIFERPTFKSWLSPVNSTKPSVLWINGPAGFGKTVLSAHIVQHLSVALDTPVAHFFFTADHESREDPFSALRSWHRQIAAKNDDAFECIRRTWENNSSENASKRVLVELLKEVVTAVPGCVLIADGLDECSSLGNGDASVARFLRDVMGVIVGTDVRLLLVSREEPEIREALAEGKDTLLEYRIGMNDVHADTAAFSQSVVDRKLASGKGYASYVKLILQYPELGHQRLLKKQNKKLETPLYLASRWGNLAVVRELLNFGAQTTLSMSNETGETPLFIAACEGHADVVKAVFEYGAGETLDILDIDDNSPLCAASCGGSTEVVKELLSHGAGRTIAISNLQGDSPLHTAAFQGNVEVLKLLLEVPGVSVNQKTTYGFSPLFIASRNGYFGIVEVLLSVDSVDKDTENWLGLSPLFAAVANGHLEVTKLLLSKGCHVQHEVSIGRDLLWWAQRSNKPDLIQLLKTQEALHGTASGSFSTLPGPFLNLEPLPRDAETVACETDFFWCYVCTLSVRDYQSFCCEECKTLMYLCAECFTRGFQLCPRSHALMSMTSSHEQK